MGSSGHDQISTPDPLSSSRFGVSLRHSNFCSSLSRPSAVSSTGMDRCWPLHSKGRMGHSR